MSIDVFSGITNLVCTLFIDEANNSVHGNIALPCILNKTAVAFALSNKPILYFKLCATRLLKPFSQDTN